MSDISELYKLYFRRKYWLRGRVLALFIADRCELHSVRKPHTPGIFVRKPLNTLMSIRKPGKMTNLRLHIDHLHHKLNK